MKIIGLLAKEIAQSIRNKPTHYVILEHEHDLKSAKLVKKYRTKDIKLGLNIHRNVTPINIY
jgi:hypothetical protein